VSHTIPAKDLNAAPLANLSDISTETRLALTVAVLFNALRGLLVILLLALAIVVPYLAANKSGSAIVVSSIALFMLVTPYTLLRRGKIMQAAWIFSAAGRSSSRSW
jgi:hypothetical protein